MDVSIACVCGRHESDVVTLRETLDFKSAITIRNAAIWARTEDPDIGIPEILAILTEQYVLLGISAWTLADSKGKPLPVNQANIRAHLLSHPEVAIDVADAADELYAEKVVLPLLQRASISSQPSPIVGSTSAKTPGARQRPTPSSPSSTESIQTDATETTTTSLAGVSS